MAMNGAPVLTVRRSRRRSGVAELAADPARLHDVLNRGNARANEIDERTVDKVRYVTDLAC
jgi:hypothetical protein